MLPRASRLHSPAEFKRTYGQGVSVVGRHMVVYGQVEAGRGTRLGISASRRVGNAVTRNRIRRRLSEAFAVRGGMLPGGTSAIIVARPRLAKLDYQNMESELGDLLVKLAAALDKEAVG